MKFAIDLDTLALTAAVKTAKRGDAASFEVSFLRAGIAEDLADETVITFAAKALNDYTGEPVVSHNTFTRSEIGTDATYSGSPSFNTDELNALFVAAEGAAQIDYVDLIAEFTWSTDGGLPSSSKTFFLRVDRDVFQGTEGTPLSLPTPEEWLAAQLAPLALSAVPGTKTSMVVSGTTSPDFNKTLLYAGTAFGFDHWTEDGAVYSDGVVLVRLTGSWTIHRIVGGVTVGSALWTKGGSLASPTDAGTWVSAGGATGTPTVTAGVSYPTPSVLGQSAIVTHSDDSITEWGAVNLSPAAWLPRTAGIILNRTTSEWERTFVSSGTIQTELLPDQ